MYHFPDLASHYHQSFNRFDSLYGGQSRNAVKNLAYIIRLGDSFLRTDVASSIQFFCDRWDSSGLWNCPALNNPARDGSVMGRLLRGFRSAEIFEHGSTVDSLRLRISRVLLCQYFSDLCVELQTNPVISEQRSNGKRATRVATEKILDKLYSAPSNQVRHRTREQW